MTKWMKLPKGRSRRKRSGDPPMLQEVRSEVVSKLPEAKILMHAEQAKAMLQGITSIATNAWRAKTKLLAGISGEAPDEVRGVYRHIERILESLQDMGVEVKDHTGDTFDYGLPLRVITTQATRGIDKETVIETIKPTVYWQNQIIQMGEVVIATPPHIQEKE